MTATAPVRRSLLSESWVFAVQHFKHWRHDPMVPVQSVIFPTFLLITYYLLVGKSVMRITGTDSLYGLVPTCAIAGAFSGSLAVGMTLTFETLDDVRLRCAVQTHDEGNGPQSIRCAPI